MLKTKFDKDDLVVSYDYFEKIKNEYELDYFTRFEVNTDNAEAQLFINNLLEKSDIIYSTIILELEGDLEYSEYYLNKKKNVLYKIRKNDNNTISYIYIYLNFLDKEVQNDIRNKVIHYYNKFSKIKKNSATIKLIVKSSTGLTTVTKTINNTENLKISYYNNDIIPFHKKMLENIDEKGLTLLHGIPGTGKTSYIKSLTKEVNKDFIFIPPSMSEILASPDLIRFLMLHSNSVLIIEDAEDCLISRNNTRSSSISNILNLTDGILADVLNVHIIATFNTNLKNLDEALLRPGRLKGQYEFKKLTAEKVREISKGALDKAATISEIFNENIILDKKQNKIGF